MAIEVETKDLMSIQEFAKAMHMPRTTVYRWAERNKVITIRLGGILFIPKSEVKRLGNEKRKIK